MSASTQIIRECVGCGLRQVIDLPIYAAVASAECTSCARRNYVSRYVRMDIGLSEVCNLNCIMCRRPQEREFMPVDTVMRSLREAQEVGIQTISFSGGEPFVHPRFREILREALAFALDVELVTNATLVRQSDIPTLEQLKCVTVSIDGPRSQHDFIRGQIGSWDATMRTVEMLAASGAKWGTNTVMQQANAEVLYDSWLEIRKRGRPSYVAFTHVEVVPETQHLQIPAAQLDSAASQIARIRDDCERDNINFNDDKLTGVFFNVFNDKSRRFRPVQGCPIPQTFLGMTNYGYFPCWHQGRRIQAASLIEALEDPLCEEIIREGLERRCVGCNSANYSWSNEWVDGVLAAYENGEVQTGVVYLTDHERQVGHIRDGKRTLPILEREQRVLAEVGADSA